MSESSDNTTAVGSMHHVGIVVRDLDQAEAFVNAAFGFPVVNRIASEEVGMRAAFLSCGPVTIELVEFSDPEMVSERLGDGAARIDHLALQVDDIDAATDALGTSGVEMIAPAPMQMPSGRVNFTKGETSGGIVWQLLEQA